MILSFQAKGWIKYISIVISFSGLILLVCLSSCKSNSSSQAQSDQVMRQVDSAVAVGNDTMKQQLDAARLLIDQLKTENAGLDSQMTLTKAQIDKLLKDLNHYKKTSRIYAAKYKTAQKLIASLKGDTKRYADELNFVKSNNDDIVRQRDSIQRKYFDLKALASVLHASNIRLVTYNLKHHGLKEKKTARARKVKVLRILFDIDENRIAEDGTKDLYIVVKGPDGNVLTNATSSGTTNGYDGKAIQFSEIKHIALKQNEPVKNVSVDWKQDADYKKGTYNVEIFNGGYDIGNGTVALK